MTGRKLGHYEVLGKLGQGGMGVVYQARDSRLRRLVALKFLNESVDATNVSQRFLREAQAASALNHPNIVTIYDISEDGGRTFIVMEYVDGNPLRKLIGENGMDAELALEHGIQIARALESAHAAGIVHRDLKPGNVIVTRDGRAKILDFGLAKFDTQPVDDETMTALTHANTFIGTVAYAAPEQTTNRQVDHRADIFSFGVMLQEMLTGRRPFSGANMIEIICEINKGIPVALRQSRPGLPASLEAMILKMLEKQPEKRFQSMGDVAESLAAVRRELQRKATLAAPEESLVGAVQARPAGGKQTLAVLRFRSLSGSAEGDFMAEGVAAEIVQGLSGVPGVRLASQTASFRFRTGEHDLTEVAAALNIRYVLTGTVRQSGARIRVIAELVDAVEGTQLWSSTYSDESGDALAAQEEIGRAIAGAVGGPLLRVSAAEAALAPSDSLDAAGLVRRAQHAVTHAYHREGIGRAIDLLRQAIAMTPDYAAPHAYLGLYLIQRAINAFSDDPERDRREALDSVERAMQLAPRDAEVLENAGLVLLQSGKYDRAVSILRRAVQIAQFDLVAWGYLALALGWGGDEREMADAEAILNRQLTGMPDHPSAPYWLYFKSGVCFRLGKYEEALDCARRSAESQPRFLVGLVNYANALGLVGRFDEAREVIGKVMAMNPHSNQAAYVHELMEIGRKAERIRPHIAGLIAAGIFSGE